MQLKTTVAPEQSGRKCPEILRVRREKLRS